MLAPMRNIQLSCPHEEDTTAETLHGAGHWLLDRRKPSEALGIFQLLTLCAPEDERGYLGLALAFQAMGCDQLAERALRDGTAKADCPCRCYWALFHDQRRRGQHGRALQSRRMAESLARASGKTELLAMVASMRWQPPPSGGRSTSSRQGWLQMKTRTPKNHGRRR